MKAQRKTRLQSETDVERRAFCSPDETKDHLREHPASTYSPGVLVSGWQTAETRKRENEQWFQHRDCARCADLRAAYCTWKPDVILRRTGRDGGYLYDRPPPLICQDREPAQDCRLMHRKQLKSLYDQHYNEHPSTQPAHVNCPDLLPEGPTNFGLLDKMTPIWQNEIAGLVALRTGPSLYRESYQGQTKDNGTSKEKHVSCKNDFGGNSYCIKTNKATQTTGSMTTFCRACPALATCKHTKVLSGSCKQEATPCQCKNTGTLLTCDRHATALDCFMACEGSHNNVSANCSVAKKSSAECGCVSDSSVQAVESENPKFNAGNELAGTHKWQGREAGTRIMQKGEPRIELTESKAAAERELQCGNNDPLCGTNDARWNVSELESGQRKEDWEWESPERNATECDFRRRDLEDCDYPDIQTTLPFMPTNVAEHGSVTGIDTRKSGSARQAFPEIGSTGNYVHGSGFDQDIDRKLERTGQRYNIPPTQTSARFVTAPNSRHDACHTCLNLSVL